MLDSIQRLILIFETNDVLCEEILFIILIIIVMIITTVTSRVAASWTTVRGRRVSPEACFRPAGACVRLWRGIRGDQGLGRWYRGSDRWGGRGEGDRHKFPREVRCRPPWLWCAIDSERKAVSSSLSMELADQLTKLVLPASASRTRHMLRCSNALSRRLCSCVCTSGSRSH